MDTKTPNKIAHYVCQRCKDQLDVSYDYKDIEQLHICQVCRKFRYCRLSYFRKTVCMCHCPCRACREAQRKRH